MKKIIASPLAPKAVGPYSQAVEAAGTIYVSGQLPIDASTGRMPEGIEAQTRQSLTNLRHILEEAGSSLEAVVKTTVLLQDMGDYISLTNNSNNLSIFNFSFFNMKLLTNILS